MAIDFKKIKIILLNKEHTELISNFTSYEKDLGAFLVDDALQNQLVGISKTYLLFYDSKLVGYVTLLMDSLHLSSTLKKSFNSINIPYKTLPALKIGRLAVDDNYLKKGFGTILLNISYVVA